jgi:hypothetical protein
MYVFLSSQLEATWYQGVTAPRKCPKIVTFVWKQDLAQLEAH